MSKRLLIIDDDPSHTELYKIRFEAEGYVVKSLRSADHALGTIISYHPDCILLDILLPGVSGDKFLKILRSTPETKSVNVVAVTALSLNNEKKQEIAHLGASCFSKVDMSLKDLVGKVNSLANQRSKTLVM